MEEQRDWDPECVGAVVRRKGDTAVNLSDTSYETLSDTVHAPVPETGKEDDEKLDELMEEGEILSSMHEETGEYRRVHREKHGTKFINEVSVEDVEVEKVDTGSSLCPDVGAEFNDNIVVEEVNEVASNNGLKPKGKSNKKNKRNQRNKNVIISPVEANRPKKRSRQEDNDPFDLDRFIGIVHNDDLEGGESQNEAANRSGLSNGEVDIDLNNLAPTSEIVGKICPTGCGGDMVVEQGVKDEVYLDKEVENTVRIGAVLGADLADHDVLVRNSIVEEGINVGVRGMDKVPWLNKLKKEHGVDFLAVQESKVEDLSNFNGKSIWRSNNYGMEFVGSISQSGGLLSIWDKGLFSYNSSIKSRNFLLVSGMLKGYNEVVNIMNVYAPQGVAAKQALWDSIGALVLSMGGMWVILGDFNVVRFPEERMGSVFKTSCARNFNTFFHSSGLMEFSMKGKRFTCIWDYGKKLSKIDRFLVCPNFFNKWPEACLRALPSHLSNHCPLLLTTVSKNFGPKPFRIFNSWLSKAGFEEAVCSAARINDVEAPPDVILTKKFGQNRDSIRRWKVDMLKHESLEEEAARADIERLEVDMEVRGLSEEEEWIYVESKKVLKELEFNKQLDIKQHSRVRWALDGDENSSFFHGFVNCRKASNNIPGLMIQESCVTRAALAKKEVFNFFKHRFVEDYTVRPRLQCWNIRSIHWDDMEILSERFSVSEIKEAVFGCGEDRAPGPDGFNMRFIKRFWHLFKRDFVNIMEAFFSSGDISVGCGSSFITLIPKGHDAVELNNFRPVSLVGIISKSISKILSNRFKNVMGKMGFSREWCVWIRGILKSARSSVLVNGSSTFEFQFGKGMRQGDPISPFLFLIVMEALSCMLNKAQEEGLIKGIKSPNDGPVISHLLFADDAIIIGGGRWWWWQLSKHDDDIDGFKIKKINLLIFFIKIEKKKAHCLGRLLEIKIFKTKCNGHQGDLMLTNR
ncbi:RNA-directed DNA polymerase, eukaryota [Artemisia annua]|uniref:RNA-directed DNA polymerase, eukaryota n=1 Tax=Artemisia annua TaxID=35608 RepID=A0A2U1NAV4_ARTAN|nr:RNA-directed DNA polymerase, eukaryota [Artemisia annua]